MLERNNMASNIISETIDANYPIAGQDNDSQGFRDNFSVIKDSLAAAKQEVEDLQLNTAKLNTANNFAGNNLIDANLSGVTEEYFQSSGTVQASQNINFDNGHYQKFGIAANNITLTITNWPESGKLAKIRLEFYKSDENGTGAYTLTIASTNNSGGTSNIQQLNWPAPTLTLATQDKSVIVDFWTADGGATVLSEYIGGLSPLASADGTIIDGDLTVLGNINNTNVSLTIGDINDILNVSINTPADKQLLSYNAGSSIWQNTTINLGDLANVDTSGATVSQALAWNGTSWSPASVLTSNAKITPAEIVIPSFTDTSRDDGTLTNVQVGATIYNSTQDKYQIYVNGAWQTVMSVKDLKDVVDASADYAAFQTAIRELLD